MAIKDFEMNIKNADGSYDILHPITKLKNVLGLADKVIVESSSNANGKYMRFGDGTLLCYANLNLTYQTPNYCALKGNKDWIYPSAFAEPPVVIPGKSSYWNYDRMIRANVSANSDNNSSSVRLYSESSMPFRSGDSLEVFVLAIGRWK